MYEKFGQFIDGKWQRSSGGESYDVINPANEEIIGSTSKANTEDVQKAIRSAAKGLEIWKKTSPWERAKVLGKISDLIRKKIEILSKHLKQFKKDKHSSVGLVKAVNRRKKLLDYLKRNKVDSYKNVLTKLNLRK